MVRHNEIEGISGRVKAAEARLPPVVGYFLNREQFHEKRLASFFPEVQKWVPMLKEPVLGVDAVVSWGYKGKNGTAGLEYATRWQKPHFRIEDGFFRSNGLGVDGAPPLSITVDDLGVFYDATRPSRLEQMLIDAAALTVQQQAEAEELIDLVRKINLTKYNLPFAPFPDHLPGRDFVLVVDQTFQDLSVTLGAAGDDHVFDRMLSTALDENPNANIVIKTHPDVVAGRKQGCLKIDSLPRNVSLLTDNICPSDLFSRTKRLYTVTSQMGFEALLFGTDVTTFGTPFYAGWGLTEDRRTTDRRNRDLSLEQLAHITLLRYCRYSLPDATGLSAPLTTLRHLGRQRQRMERYARASSISDAPLSLVEENDEDSWTQGLTRLASAVLNQNGTTIPVKRTVIQTLSEIAHAVPANNMILSEWCAEQAMKHLASVDRSIAYQILKDTEETLGLSEAGRLQLASLALSLKHFEVAERSAHKLMSSDPESSEAFDVLCLSYKKRGLYDQIISAASGRLARNRDMSRESFGLFVHSVIEVGQAELLADSILNLAPRSVDPILVRALQIELLFSCKRFADVVRHQLSIGPSIADHFDAAIAHVASLFMVGQRELGFEMIRYLESKWSEDQQNKLPIRLLKKLNKYNAYDAVLEITALLRENRILTGREKLLEIRALIGTGQSDIALTRLDAEPWKPNYADNVIELRALAWAAQRKFDKAAVTLSKGFALQNAPLPRAHRAALHHLDAGNDTAADDLISLAWTRVEEQVLGHNQPDNPDEIIQFVYLRRAFSLTDWLIEHLVRHGWPGARAAIWTRKQHALMQHVGSLGDYADRAATEEVISKAPKLAKAAGLVPEPSSETRLESGRSTLTLGVSNLFSSGAHDDLAAPRAFYSTLLASAEAAGMRVCPVNQWRGNDRALGGEMRKAEPDSLKLVWHGYGNSPNVIHVKDAALKGYMTLDQKGYAGWSSIAGEGRYKTRISATDPTVAEQTFQQLRAEFIGHNLSKYDQPSSSFAATGPYVFFAMQMIEDTVSRNARIPMLDFADAVIDWAKDRGLTVVFKRHPRCIDARVSRFLALSHSQENVILTNDSIHSVLPGAEAVFTVNSGVGLEALLHLKKVIISGRAEYESCCVPVHSTEELHGLSLDSDAFPDPDVIKKFLHVYARVYCCRSDDKSRITRRVNALARLRSV